MELKPILSVIVTCFNNITTITAAIRSIPCDPRIEVVVVDDCSTDGTGDLVPSLLRGSSNYILINTINKGVSSARNKGIGKARGQFLTFLDGDDVFIPEEINSVLDSLDENCTDVLITNHKVSNSALDERVGHSYNQITGPLSEVNKRDLITLFLKNPVGNSIIPHVWAKFYKTSYIKEGKFNFDEKISLYEDTLFLAELITSKARFNYLDLVTYQHNICSESLSTDLNENLLGFVKPLQILSEFATRVDLFPKANAVYLARILTMTTRLSSTQRRIIFKKLANFSRTLPTAAFDVIRDKRVRFILRWRLLYFPIFCSVILSQRSALINGY